MIRLSKRWYVVILVLLSGCALLQPPPISLLNTNSEYSLLVVQQQWQVSRAGEDYRLQAMLQLEERRWTLVIMDSLGQRLATLVHEQALAVQIHKSHPLQRHWVELAQKLQFIYWPLADLQQLGVEGWIFSDREKVREVLFSGILAGHVVYSDDTPWQGITRYTHNKSGLQLVIESRPLRVQER